MSISKWLYKKLIKYFVKDKPHPPSPLCDFQHVCHELQLVDVILVEGRSRIDKVIQHITLSSWTHSALYIGRLEDIQDPHILDRIQKHYKGKPADQLIIESNVGRGTYISKIQVHKNEHLRICRPAGLAVHDAQHVIAHATESLGRSYDIRQFFDLGRLFLKSIFIPPKFRSKLFEYNPNKTTEEICSTMVAEAFMSVKFPILPLIRKKNNEVCELIHRNPRLYVPSDFDYSPYFKIIKYPIFNLEQPAHYRNLPWNEGYYSNDEHGLKKFTDTKKTD